ncbi:MAG: phosphotransferase [Nanoarchaeota archaeon]|nr:phosphotransferase [Nanoarchaeota archaeon]
MKLQIKKHIENINPLNFKLEEKITSIKKLSRGESNINYLIKTNKSKYIIRFDITNKSTSKFKQEFTILKKITKLNISSKPLFIDTTKKYFKENYMVLSYLEGISLDSLDKKVYVSKLNKMPAILANIHNTNIIFDNKLYSFEKRVNQTNTNIKKIKKELNQYKAVLELCNIYSKYFKILIKKYRPKLKFCHGDVCLPNILFNKGNFYLIDWEAAGNYDPALELSYHFYELNYTTLQRNNFLRNYLKLTKDETLKKRILFADFYLAFSGYFDILVASLNIARNKGHKEYLDSADFKEYWNWGNYYLGLVFKLNLFNRTFERRLKIELKEIYNNLKN